MDKLHEKTLSSSYLYRGKIINVRQDQVKTGDDKNAFREVVEHPGAVAILAVDKNDEIVLVRQHRQPAGEVLLEIPAGKIEPGEDPLDCARRELLEETGLAAENWSELCCFYPSPGFCDEIIYLYLAEGTSTEIAATGDPEENIKVEKMPLKDAANMINTGGIKDGKTIIAVQHAMIKRFKT